MILKKDLEVIVPNNNNEIKRVWIGDPRFAIPNGEHKQYNEYDLWEEASSIIYGYDIDRDKDKSQFLIDLYFGSDEDIKKEKWFHKEVDAYKKFSSKNKSEEEIIEIALKQTKRIGLLQCYANFNIQFDFQKIKSFCSKEYIEQIENKTYLGFIGAPPNLGDGTYRSNSGFDYFVDSGSLGCVPDYMTPIGYTNLNSYKNEEGKFFDVNGSIKMTRKTDGSFIFEDNDGPFEKIYTNCDVLLLFDEDIVV